MIMKRELTAGLFLIFAGVAQAAPTYPVIDMPVCTDAQGRVVTIKPAKQKKMRLDGSFLAQASREAPVIEYDAAAFTKLRPEMQHFVIRHECEHQNKGLFMTPIDPMRETTDEENTARAELFRANERAADCGAATSVQADLGYGRAEFAVIESETRRYMTGLKFPSFVIDRKLEWIRACGPK